MMGADRDFCGLSADSAAEDEPVWLSYAEAARRVSRSVHTIHLWRKAGMVMGWDVDETGQRFRVVEETVLLAWWRDRMKASPVHFYRIRRAAIENGETPPPIPDRFRGRPNAIQTPPHISGVSEDAEDAGLGSERITDVLAELPDFKGQAEHAALMTAMENETPACDGLDVFTRDRFDDPEQTKMMRGICRDCPLIDLCAAFVAAGKPTAGMWAGMTPADIRRASAPGATLAA